MPKEAGRTPTWCEYVEEGRFLERLSRVESDGLHPSKLRWPPTEKMQGTKTQSSTWFRVGHSIMPMVVFHFRPSPKDSIGEPSRLAQGQGMSKGRRGSRREPASKAPVTTSKALVTTSFLLLLAWHLLLLVRHLLLLGSCYY